MTKSGTPLLCRLERSWGGQTAIIAGTGPSLPLDLPQLKGHALVVAVNSAVTVIPNADMLYACDAVWWNKYGPDLRSFSGERWSSHSEGLDYKRRVAAKWGVSLVEGREGVGFSSDPSYIHYGRNSGFQALNIALLRGCAKIILVGFDMRHAYGAHFFGDYPTGAGFKRHTDHSIFVQHFERAVSSVPAGVQIINATPNSGLTAFPMMSLEEALRL